MAKKARAKSEAQKRLDVTIAELKIAKDKLAKQATDANKKTVEHLKAEAAKYAAPVKRERFTIITAGRVTAALHALTNTAKCANTRDYEFNSADIEKLEKVLTERVQTTVQAFRNALDNPGGPAAHEEKFLF